MENNTEQQKRPRGRPPKYHTEEERHAAQLEQMRNNYAKKTENNEPKQRGVKPFRTLEDIRLKQREYQRKFREKKKLENKE